MCFSMKKDVSNGIAADYYSGLLIAAFHRSGILFKITFSLSSSYTMLRLQFRVGQYINIIVYRDIQKNFGIALSPAQCYR